MVFKPQNLAAKKGVVRLIYGEDGFRVHERVKYYAEAFSRQHDPNNLSVARFCAPDFEIDELHRAINTPPLFADKRLFIVSGFSKLKLSEEKEEFIIKDIKNLAANSVIVTEEMNEKEMKTNRFFKKIKPDSIEYIPPLRGYHLEKEIRERFEKEGANIEPAALKKFLSLVGDDFWKINSEIKKLINYIGPLAAIPRPVRAIQKQIPKQVRNDSVDSGVHRQGGVSKPEDGRSLVTPRVISLKDVDEVTLADLADNCFSLVDYLMQKDKKNTSRELKKLLFSGIGAESIFSQIGFGFRQLLEIAVLMEEKRANSSMVARALKMHPYRAQILCQSAKNFTTEELKNIHNLIIDADYKIKTGRIKPDAALDLFLAHLVG